MFLVPVLLVLTLKIFPNDVEECAVLFLVLLSSPLLFSPLFVSKLELELPFFCCTNALCPTHKYISRFFLASCIAHLYFLLIFPSAGTGIAGSIFILLRYFQLYSLHFFRFELRVMSFFCKDQFTLRLNIFEVMVFMLWNSSESFM